MPEPTTEPLLSHLDELLDTEQAIAQHLARCIAMHTTSERRELLNGLLQQSRRHAGQLERSLVSHRHQRGLARLGYDVGLRVGSQVLASSMQLPRMLLRRNGNEPQRQLHATRDLTALVARQVAAATALEELAASAGDEPIQQLAHTLRSDHAQAHEQLLHDITLLADDVMATILGGDGSTSGVSAGQATRARSRPS